MEDEARSQDEPFTAFLKRNTVLVKKQSRNQEKLIIENNLRFKV